MKREINTSEESGLIINTQLHDVLIAYIKDYFYTVSERSFNDVRDGLKPVLRRIMTIMWERNITQFRKVAYVSGATMGELHPHGDASINDVISSSMQDFNLNYPYFDAQGNCGSIEGDPAAAARYLETKLAKFSQDVITDNIKEYALQTIPNYDMRRTEFKYLPTKIPLILLQPCQGIGEGFMLSSPSYNLSDIVKSVIAVIKNKNITLKELTEGIYPDYPTGGIVTNKSEFKQFIQSDAHQIEALLQENKRYQLRIKAQSQLNNEKNTIEITGLPYGTVFQTIGEQIIDEVRDKNNIILSGILSTGSHKDKQGKIVFDIICKKDANLLEIQNELYRRTQLCKTIPLSNIYYCDNAIKRMSFKDIILYWYETQVIIKRRMYNYDYSTLQNQLHIWQGLIKIYDKRNDVIELIKQSEDKQEAILKIEKQLGLSLIQAKGIVEMQLVSLARTSKANLETNIARGMENLKIIEYNMEHIDDILIKEATEIEHKYKRDRRTEIVDESVETKTNITISCGAILFSRNSFGVFNPQGLSNNKTLLNSLKPIKIDGKSVKEITGFHCLTGNITGIIVFDNEGFAKRLSIKDIPLINTWIVYENQITCIVPIYENQDGTIIAISEDMNIRRIKVSDITSKVTTGVIIAAHYSAHDDEMILCYNQEGKYLYIEGEEIPSLNRNATGNKIEFNRGDQLVLFPLDENTDGIVLCYGSTENFISCMSINDLHVAHRTNKPKAFMNVKNMQFRSADPISFENKEDGLLIGVSAQNITVVKIKLLKINMSPKKVSIKPIGFIQI